LSDQSRLSLPIFLNPSLKTIVTPMQALHNTAESRTTRTSIGSCHRANLVAPFCSEQQSGAGRGSMYGAPSA
jgi:hypothetical protein